MLALFENSSFLTHVVPGGWFSAPGLPPTCPASAGWSRNGFALYEIEPAPVAPAGKRWTGEPSYSIEGGKAVESYALEDIPITAADVIAERERRLAMGFDFDFGDARGVHHFGTTTADMLGWDEVTQLAQAKIALGDTDSTIAIITETGPASVTAMEWQAILAAAGAHRQPIWAASFALQLIDPIPADYADESHWT